MAAPRMKTEDPSRRPSGGLLKQDHYDLLRDGGMSADQAAQVLGLGEQTRRNYQIHYNGKDKASWSDSSCPQFAHHDLHVTAILRHLPRGFPRAVVQGGRVAHVYADTLG